MLNRYPSTFFFVFLSLTLSAPATSDEIRFSTTEHIADGLVKAAIIGGRDERLDGAYFAPQTNGTDRASLYLARAMRIWFPHPGSVVVTGTPVCFPDVVLTAAHVYANVGDGTAKPKGLRVSIPDLERPGDFLGTLTVKDYMLSSLGRRYNPNEIPDVRNDFLVLLLNKSLPDHIVPVSLRPFDDVAGRKTPIACDSPTINAAYHADLGVSRDRVVSTHRSSGQHDIIAVGKVPLLTASTGYSAKTEEGQQFGKWYSDPFVVFPEHDTHESASGSAMVCPAKTARGTQRDYLQGVMVGQVYLDDGNQNENGYRTAINVATVNLENIHRAIAKLKGVPVETLHRACEPFVRSAINRNFADQQHLSTSR